MNKIVTQTVLKSALYFAFILAPVYSQAQNTGNNSTLRAKHFNLSKSALALQGYDPMSYFLGKPRQGLEEFSYVYLNVQYRFVSARNLELFKSNPSKFEPAFGGWCAYAMGFSGEKVEVDPETYKIVDGKLYLFYHTIINNTLLKWNKDEVNLNKNAMVNWNKTFN